MKIPTLILTVFCACWNLVLWAQNPNISATPSQGCDSLKVNFSYSSSLTSPTAEWNFGDGTSDTAKTPIKTFRKPGKFNVTLTLNGTYSSSIPIYVGRTPRTDSLSLAISHRDTTISGNYPRVIEVSYNNNHPFPFSYQWTIDGTNVNTNRSFYHVFDTVGNYTIGLVMTDSVGCSASFTELLVIANEIEVPNVFTPDGSQHNVFYIKYNDQDVISFKVFTRAGILIYRTEAKTIAWDGRLPSGDKVLPGIYFYVLETINTNNPIKKSGFFYIFR